MRFTQTLIAALTAAAAQAVFISNSDFSGIAVGKPFNVTYAGGSGTGTVTLYLGSGTPANVIQGDAIGSSTTTEGFFLWTPTSGGSYALKIVDSGAPSSSTNPNFSGFFSVSGPVVSSSSTTAMSSSSSTTGVSSSTSSSTATVNTTSTITYSTSTPAAPTNGTMTMTRTQSAGSSGSQSSPTSTLSQVPNSMAAGLASPLALVLLAAGALLTLN